MNTSKGFLDENFDPVRDTFKDITLWRVVFSSLKVMYQIYQKLGLKMSLRVIPIIWTLVEAIRGFARYSYLEFNELRRCKIENTDYQEHKLTIEDELAFQKLGASLCTRLNKLGPTFIKIGQMFSTRADLLPLSAMTELAKLQEEVATFDNNLAFRQIERDLGRPKEELFASFDPNPIAAASLSQAYKAKLFDGRDVVVKIQRPDLLKIISSDVLIISCIAQEIMNYPTLCRHTDWPSVVEEFAKTIYDEIDYLKEGRNADKFRHNFRKFDEIYIPRIIWKYTGRHVLTIEYVDGYKITDSKAIADLGLNVNEITKLGARFYLQQLLIDGFFHADPHPGNMRVLNNGTIAIFDFGMVGIISPNLKQNLVNSLLHVIKKDYKALIGDFISMGILSPQVNIAELSRELEPVINARFSSGLSKVKFKQLLFDFSDICWRYPFSLPSEFTYIMRALLTLEGVALSINPNFDFISAAMPIARTVVLNNNATIGNVIFKEVFTDGRFSPSKAIGLLKTARSLRDKL